MGRQVNFYMLPVDEQLFFNWILRNPNISFLETGSYQPELKRIDSSEMMSEIKGFHTILLWNHTFKIDEKDIVPQNVRIYDETIGGYHETGQTFYSINKFNAPVIEYSRSFMRKNELQIGRIWASMKRLQNDEFISKGKDFENWYDEIARWLRRNLTLLKRDYFGAEALKWYQAGGNLVE